MENPQNLQQAANDNNAQDHSSHHHHGGGGGGNKAMSGNNGNSGGFLCRQSSSRWTPTTDQIRILKELYYTNGMRSPTAEQIQKISARLRQYGKIEGKNVFYWFQNHKARERQKKRFTSDHNHNHNHNLHHHYNHNHNNNNPMQRNNVTGNNNINNNNNNTASDFQAFHHGHMKYSNLYPVVGSVTPSPASVVEISGMNCPYGYDYGGVPNIEKAFREQCGSSGANGGSMAHNLGWVGSVDQYGLFDLRSTVPVDEDQALSPPEIETLPLFPVHGAKINSGGGGGGGGYYSSWFTSNQGGGVGHVGSRTSLELSLNCYGRRSPDSIS